MTSPRQVEVNTREFEFHQGKQPRGYGNWAFFMHDGSVFWHNGSYGEAAKAAKNAAAAKGFREVKVGA